MDAVSRALPRRMCGSVPRPRTTRLSDLIWSLDKVFDFDMYITRISLQIYHFASSVQHEQNALNPASQELGKTLCHCRDRVYCTLAQITLASRRRSWKIDSCDDMCVCVCVCVFVKLHRRFVFVTGKIFEEFIRSP